LKIIIIVITNLMTKSEGRSFANGKEYPTTKNHCGMSGMQEDELRLNSTTKAYGNAVESYSGETTRSDGSDDWLFV